MKPGESWAARWQGISTFVPGCYALRVRGTLPSEHIVTLEDNGIRYRSLDESAQHIKEMERLTQEPVLWILFVGWFRASPRGRGNGACVHHPHRERSCRPSSLPPPRQPPLLLLR